MLELSMLECIKNAGNDPIVLSIMILLATFILEDAATISAALLSANGALPWMLALTALYVGIFFGDLGLYGLGKLARTNARAAKWIGEVKIAKGRDWLSGRLISSLVAARFVPGLRLPAYTASGYLNVSFTRFAIVAAIAAAVWTPLLFFAVLTFGAGILDHLGPWKYVAGIILVLMIVAGPWIARKLGFLRT